MIFSVTAETTPAVAHLAPAALLDRVAQSEALALAVANDQMVPQSILIYEGNDQICNLLWLFTNPDCRNLGYGTQLLEALRSVTQGWEVSLTLPDHHPAYFFFARHGFFQEDIEHITYETQLNYLPLHPLWKKGTQHPQVRPLAEVAPALLHTFSGHVQHQGNPSQMDLPLNPAAYTVALGFVEGDKELTGVLLLVQQPDNSLYLQSIHVLDGNSAVTAALLQTAGTLLLEQYAPTTKLFLTATNKKADRLVRGLLRRTITHRACHLVANWEG